MTMRFSTLLAFIIAAVASARLLMAQPPLDIEATRVTLKLTDVPPQQAFEQFAEQTGISVRPTPTDLWERAAVPRTISIDLQNEAFGRALIELCRAARVVPAEDPQAPRQLLLRPEEGSSPPLPIVPPPGAWAPDPRAASDPVARAAPWTRSDVIAGDLITVVLHSIRVQSIMQTHTERQPSSNITLSFYVITDPKLRLQSRVMLWTAEMLDEKGQSLLANDARNPPQRIQSHEIHPASGLVASATATVNWVDTGGKEISRLALELHAIALVDSAVLEVGNILEAEPLEQDLAGLRVRVEKARTQHSLYEVPVTFFRDQRPQQQWQQLPQRLQDRQLYRLLDHRGQSLAMQSVRSGGTSQEQLQLIIQFNRQERPDAPPVGLPQTFVMELPLHARELTLPVEFTDLPLP